MQKLFKKNDISITKNTHNCLIYGNKNDFINEDIFFKEKETIDINLLYNHKSSIDSNLSYENLHEFLNEDLIKALDNDFMEPDDFNDKSDSSSSNAYISESSNYTSNLNSPEPIVKLQKKDEKDLNLPLNKEICNNVKISDANIILDVNINNNINSNINNIENCQANKETIKEKVNDLDENIKDKIKMLNDPLFAPMIIPNEENIEKVEEKKREEKEYIKDIKKIKKEKKNNSLKNKFGDDVEPIIMLSMTNLEEKTKLPLEIRVGDWICLYCNNLNFSFRIKCNRCGLLRKSTTHLLKKKIYSNKYQCMGNYNNFKDSFNINFNNNYDLNYNNNYSNL